MIEERFYRFTVTNINKKGLSEISFEINYSQYIGQNKICIPLTYFYD